jgi:hypothetical protein
MKKIFWYVLVPIGIILGLVWGVPRAIDWAREREAARMRAMEEQAQKAAEKLTKPAKDAIERSHSEALEVFQNAQRHRAQKIMEERGRELDQAGTEAEEDQEF